MRNPMTKLLSFAGLLLLPILPFSGCLNDGGTEIPNEVKGTLYTSTGAPAANAQVTLYPVNYEPGAEADSDSGRYTALTNASGRYTLKKVSSGEYNLVASRQNAFAFQDSILVVSETTELPADTLRAPGTLTATVQLQPQHSPQTATVQVLGTDYYTNVPANGRFTLSLPQGTHRLRVVVSLPEYTPLFRTVTVTSGVNDTLPDPLVPFYSGIPAVTGLTATADSLGMVTLRWNNSGYAALQRYLVYRVDAGSLSQGSIIGNTTDTSFTDTVFAQAFGQNPGTGRFYFSDTVPRSYDYRVRVLSLTDEIGLAFGFVTATARSAAVYQGIPAATGLIAVADSSGKVALQWGKSPPDYAGAFRIYRATAGSGSTGTLIATVTGTTFTDTVFAQSYGQAASGTRFAFTDTVPRTFDYRVQTMGSPSGESGPASLTNARAVPVAPRSGRWRLASASAPFATNHTGTGPVALVFQNALWVISLNDSWGSAAVWRSVDGMSWQNMLNATPFNAGNGYNIRATVLRDTMWMLSSSSGTTNSLWKSGNGTTWTQVGGNMTFPSQQYDVRNNTLHAFKDELWAVGGHHEFSIVTLQNRAFYGAGNGSWSIADYPPSQYGQGFRIGLSSRNGKAVFDSKFWMVGGGTEGLVWLGTSPSDSLNSSVWSSSDGLTWSKALATAPFLPRGGHALATHDGKLWMIGGHGFVNASSRRPNSSEVWNSADGVTWNLVDLHGPFTARQDAAVVSFQGKLWVIGGISRDNASNATNTLNDIWYYE